MANNGCTFEFTRAARSKPGGVLIVPLIVKPRPPMAQLSQIDAECGGAVSELLSSGATRDEVGHVAQTTRGSGFRRVAVVSLAPSDRLRGEDVEKAGRAVAGFLMRERIKQATLWIDALVACQVDDAVARFGLAMVLAGFRFEELKEPEKDAVTRVRVELRAGEAAHVNARLPRIKDAALLAGGVNYTRQIAHRPGNVIQPTSLATEARRLARNGKLKCTVLDTAQLQKRNMNGLLAVGRGAEHPPCLIRLDYRNAPKSRVNVVIVGKAVTFDTGGYSIKPAQGLEALKFDKCGGATVLGVMKAVADLGLKCNLTGLVGAAENAISDRAYRPGDILRMASGKTVEVTNTDAEGRLVLADALWYAQKNCKPTVIIDLATLTGGVVIALGRVAAGLMTNDDDLAVRLDEAGRRAGERLWRLPLFSEYRDLIKGHDSDIRNSAGKRDAHPIVGGIFLNEFVDAKVPWAHIDIAGTATDDNANATGFGVRLLVEYLQRRG